MIVLSVKWNLRAMAAGALAVLLAAGGFWVRSRLQADAVSLPAGQPVSRFHSPTLRSNEERLAYVRSFGWEIEEEPVEILEVLIPEEFGPVYEQYNAIQKEQGFDLSRCRGRRCRRYTYAVTNYPGEKGVRFNLLLYKDKVVGGDVCSTRADGFMHGFDRRTDQTASVGEMLGTDLAQETAGRPQEAPSARTEVYTPELLEGQKEP